jgi:hypothetical protein
MARKAKVWKTIRIEASRYSWIENIAKVEEKSAADVLDDILSIHEQTLGDALEAAAPAA